MNLKMQWAGRQWMTCVLLLVCMSAPLNLVTAQTKRNTLSIPTNPANTGAFTATISLVDSEGPGYIQVKIDVKSTSVFTADKQLMFRLQPLEGGHSPPQNGIAVEIPVTVEQNSAQKTVTKMLPKWSVGSQYRLDVYDDGNRMEYYSGTVGRGVVSNWYSPPINFLQDEYRLNLSVIADPVTEKSDAAVKSLLVAAITSQANDQSANYMAQYANVNYGQMVSSPESESSFSNALVLPIRPTQLETDWRVYQSTDAILISVSQLASVKKSQPEQFQAIRNWVLCGGTIVVLNVDEMQQAADTFGVKLQVDKAAAEKIRFSLNQERSWRHTSLTSLKQYLGTVEKTKNYLKQLQKQAVDDRKAAEKKAAAKTNKDSAKQANAQPGPSAGTDAIGSIDDAGVDIVNEQYLELAFQANLANNSVPGGRSGSIANLINSGYTLRECERELVSLTQRIAELERMPKNSRIANEIWVQNVGAGRLIGMHKDCEYSSFDWEILARTFDFRRSPIARRGVDPVLGDRRVSDWLIAGVAQPPVYIFIGLLALFMILVGPIAYRRTHRAGRGYLMFAIAPVLAFITTVAMFTYGVMADGFGTVSRIRQLTWVDGVSGDAGERVRATYFAGVRPSAGLSFAPDAEVCGYPNHNGLSWEELNTRDFSLMGTVEIKDDRQQFDNSFIPSRAQKQFVVHQPRKNIGRLTLTPGAGAGEAPTVTSTFDFELRHVTLFDKHSVAWIIDKIPANAQDVTCGRIKQDKYEKRLADLYNYYRPLGRVRYSRSSRRSSNYNYGSDTTDLVSIVNQKGRFYSAVKSGAFETYLEKTMKFSESPHTDIFFGVADVSKDAVAIEGAELSDSVRFVYGTLP